MAGKMLDLWAVKGSAAGKRDHRQMRMEVFILLIGFIIWLAPVRKQSCVTRDRPAVGAATNFLERSVT